MAESMNSQQLLAALDVLDEVVDERKSQHEKWGEQNLPSFLVQTPNVRFLRRLDDVRHHFRELVELGTLTFSDILEEEFLEAMVERDPASLRAELIQVAAVCCQWVEMLDRQGTKP